MRGRVLRSVVLFFLISAVLPAMTASAALPLFGAPTKLLATGGGADGYNFNNDGYAVAIDGDTMVSGAPRNLHGLGNGIGCVYVYTRSGSGWVLQEKIVPRAGYEGTRFGDVVALDGDTLLVGDRTGELGMQSSAGLVEVYQRTGSTWAYQTTLPEPAVASGNAFGSSVALEGDRAIVGAPGSNRYAADGGSVYVFQRTAGTWDAGSVIDASGVSAGDLLGKSVALSGDTAVAGAPDHDIGGDVNAGAVHVFTKSGPTWTQQGIVTATPPGTGDSLGLSVALSGDTILAGADTADPGYAGAAYVFTRSGSLWAEQQKLVGSDTAAGDRFGNGLALLGNTAVVGARSADIGSPNDVGAAYVFTRTGTTWTQAQKLIAPDAVDADEFGSAVAFDGTRVVAGANYQTNTNGSNAGAVYVFAPALPEATTVTIRTSATSARIGGAPILRGAVTPASLIGKNMVVWVKKPGRAYWTYSSNRTMYSVNGAGAWYYKYTFKKGMTKGYYYFRGVVPAMDGYLTSMSPTIRIQLR